MRLNVDEAKAIREEVRNFDANAEIYLHGSRTDDSSKGGDIDLLVVSDKLGFRDLIRLRIAILDRIGWQQLDLAVRRHDQLNEPLATVARETGVRL
jgi:predicted nucleotidyltransferase